VSQILRLDELAVDAHGLGCELDADGGPGVEAELVPGELVQQEAQQDRSEERGPAGGAQVGGRTKASRPRVSAGRAVVTGGDGPGR
jgi:hypothetical protein